MNNSNRNQIILSIAVLFLGIFVTVGSYAYWTFSSSTNKTIVFNTAADISEYINYDSGESKFIGDFQVSNDYCQGMHTTISISKDDAAASYTLMGTVLMDINQIGEYMKQSSAVKWTITQGNANSAGSTTCPSGSILNSGNFYGTNANDTITLYTPFEVTTTEKQFTVWLWIDSNEVVNPNLTGETLDVEVYTQVDQIINNNVEITKAESKYGTIYATVVNNKNNITKYAVTATAGTPSNWTTIPANEQSNIYNLEHTVSSAGTYYVWFMDSENNTVSKSVTVESVDSTPPTCVIEEKNITYGNNGTINVSCTDTGSGLYNQKLTTSNFQISDTNIATITSVSDPVEITNGYKYTLTINPVSAGSYNLSIKANSIKDNNGNTNILTTQSETISYIPYTITLDGQSPTTQNTSTLYGIYGNGVYLDSSYATLATTSSNPITIPLKSGYTFEGYYTDSNGNGTQMISASGYITSSFTNKKYNSNTTLYAKWTANTYTVTANANGGTIPSTTGWTGTGSTSTKSVTYGSSYGTLPTPTRQGYTFQGWEIGIPDEYQLVEYIESTGTQYINTSRHQTSTTDIEVTFMNDGNNIANQRVFGQSSTANNTRYQMQMNNNNPTSWLIGIAGTNTTVSLDATKSFQTIKFVSGTGFYINGTLTNTITNTEMNQKYIWLFAGYDKYSSLKIANAKIWQDGILIKNMFPCYRKSDGVIGMYDTVQKQFQINAGTGSFIKGANVSNSITSTTIESLPYDHTIYAKWTPNTYTLTVNPNSGTYNSSTSNTTVTRDYDMYYTLNTPIKVGYSFSSWTLIGSGTLLKGIGDGKYTSVDNNWTATQKTENGEKYYNYKITTSTNTFSSDYWMGVNYSTFTVTAGHTYEITFNMRINKHEGGGYIWPRLIGVVGETTPIDSPASSYLTLFSKTDGWVKYTLTRKFDTIYTTKNGATVTAVPYFQIITNNLKGTAVDYDFDVKDVVLKDVTSSTYLYGNDDIYKFASSAGTVTANWIINSYTLTVNPNGGTFGGSTTNTTYTQNYNTTKVLGNPTANASYTISYNANSQSATYTATPTSVARSFSSWTVTSGSGSLSSGTYTYGAGNGTVTANYNTTSNNFTLPTITKKGYTCKWAEGSASGTKYDGGSTRTITSNTTYYAVCTVNAYKINLNNQDATSAGTSAVWYQYNTTQTIDGTKCYYYTDSNLTTCLTSGYTITNPSKTGYTFGGYYTQTSGSGTQYVNSSGTFNNGIYSKLPSEINSSYTDEITLYAKWNDSQAPSNVSITNVTNTVKSTTQSATLSCTDNEGVVGYYLGAAMPTSSSSYTSIVSTSSMNITKTISSAGTHYFACYDAAGNMSQVESTTLNSYKVYNMLVTTTGTIATYNTDNYGTSSSPTYLAKPGTTINISDIYTVPTGSNVNRYIGVSSGTPSTETVTMEENLTLFTLNDNVTYAMWFSRNVLTFRYLVRNDETLRANTSTYTWTTDSDGYVMRSSDGGETYSYTSNSYRYGVTTIDLANYNNTSALYISKTGYTSSNNTAWICIEGCKTANTVFRQTSYSVTLTNFCSVNISDCSVTVGVNWSSISYSIAYSLRNGVSGENAPASASYDSIIQIDNPTKEVTVLFDENSTGATITGGGSVTATPTFTGWTANASLNTSTAKYGSSSDNVTSSWSSTATKVTNQYFKNLRSASGTVTLYANWSSTITLPTITKPGYICGFAASSTDTTIAYDSGGTYTIPNASAATMSLYAVCVGETYTVGYSYGGSHDNGLISEYDGYYNMGSSHSQSTNTWYDLKGNNNGTVTNPSWGTNYLEFDGTTGVKLGVMDTDYQTIEVTFSLDSFPTTNSMGIIGNWQTAGGGIHVTTAKKIVGRFYINGGYNTVTSGSTLSLNTVYNVALRYDGSSIYLYVNGSSAGSVSVSGTITQPGGSIPMAIGGNPNTTGWDTDLSFLDGKVYYAAIYDRALTLSEIQSDMKKVVSYGSTYGTLPTSNVGFLSFDGWYTEETGGTKITSDSVYTMTQNQTLYAHDTEAYLMFGSSAGATSKFLQTDLLKGEIKSIRFEDSLLGHTKNGIDCWDVSAAHNETVLMWIENTVTVDGVDYYEVVIGENGGVIAYPSASSYLFSYLTNLTNIDFTNFDTSNITNMQSMFQNCSSLVSLNLSNFDTSNVTNMQSMFQGCSSLVSLNLSNFDTSNVTRMLGMFISCSKLTALDLSSFDTSKVTTMQEMFYGCSNLKTIYVTSGLWDNSNVSTLTNTFQNCSSIVGGNGTTYSSTSGTYARIDTAGTPGYLTEKPLGDRLEVGTTEGATTKFLSTNILKGEIESINFADSISGYTANGTNCFDVSYNKNGSVLAWVTDNDEDELYEITIGQNDGVIASANARYLFSYLTSLESINFTNFDTSEITTMTGMFYGDSSLSSLNLSNFNTSKVISTASMFYGDSNLSTLNLSNFDTSKVTTMSSMFYGDSSLSTLNLSNFDTSKVTTMSSMFYGDSSLSNLNLSNFNTSKVTTMYNMFGNCSGLTSLNVSSFDTSKVTNMNRMFYNCKKLTTLDVTNFDTSNVTAMGAFNSQEDGMFSNCSNLTTLDLSSFDTSKVTSVSRMFKNCSKLRTIYVSANLWNTSNLSSENKSIGETFYGCSNIIGGNGTTHSSNSGIYARIDTAGTPGYLTEKPLGDRLEVGTTGGATTKFLSTNILKGEIESINFADSTSGHTVNDTDCWDVSVDKNGSVLAWATDSDSDGYYEVTIGQNDGVIASANARYLFSYLTSLENINFTNFDTSEVTSMAAMFYGDSSLISLDLSIFDTGKVTSMNHMFNGASSLSTLNISNFDTSKVIGMSYMFANTSLNTLNLSNFNTSNVTNMSYMFYTSSSLTTLDLSSFNTSKVTTMEGMFQNCSGLSSLDLSGFDTSKVTTMFAMFQNCSSLTSIDVTNFDTSNVKSFGSMFEGMTGITTLDLSSFNTSKVTDIKSMFYNDRNLKTIYVSSNLWDNSNFSVLTTTFQNCTSIVGGNGTTYSSNNGAYARIDTAGTPGYLTEKSSLDTLEVGTTGGATTEFLSTDILKGEIESIAFVDSISGHSANGTDCWDVSAYKNDSVLAWATDSDSDGYYEVTIGQNDGVIASANARYLFSYLTSLESINFTNFDTSEITTMTGMFYGDNSLTNLDLTNFDTSEVTSMQSMFYENNSLSTLNLSNFNTSNVKYMTSMFNGASGLTTLDLSHFSTGSVTNMSYMFANTSLSTLNLSNFDTSNVTNMSYMFYTSSSLTTLDLSHFSTGSVTNMSYMFANTSLSTLNLSNFDTSNVTNMSYMFSSSSSLADINLSSFTTGSVTGTNMINMFSDCRSLSTLDLSSFDTSNISKFDNMFRGCSSLTTLDLSSFDTSNISSIHSMFQNCSNLRTIYASSLWNISSSADLRYAFSGCSSIVGGAGTTYSDSSGIYARIDNPPDSPGYLTLK